MNELELNNDRTLSPVMQLHNTVNVDSKESKLRKKRRNLFKNNKTLASFYLKHTVRPNWEISMCQRLETDFRLPGFKSTSYFSSSSALQILRRSLLNHDWKTAANALLLTLERGSRRKLKYIIRACLPIIFLHPNATPENIFEFFESVTEYTEDKDIETLVHYLFRIKRNVTLNRWAKRGVGVKKTKVISDPRFRFSDESSDEENT